MARHRRCLDAAIAAAQVPPGSGAMITVPPALPPGPVRSDRTAVRTRQRHAAIHQMLADGRSVRAIGLELGLARNTVRRFARTTDPEELLVHDGTGRRPSMLQDYEPYLRERWNAGCADAARLWQEIRARGYPGGYSLVPRLPGPAAGHRRRPAPCAGAAEAPEGDGLDHGPPCGPDCAGTKPGSP